MLLECISGPVLTEKRLRQSRHCHGCGFRRFTSAPFFDP